MFEVPLWRELGYLDLKYCIMCSPLYYGTWLNIFQSECDAALMNLFQVPKLSMIIYEFRSWIHLQYGSRLHASLFLEFLYF
jgi:hypothetical protein